MSSQRIHPASGAIIMANGIFLYGGIQAFPLIDLYLGEFFAILLFIAWLFIYWKLSIQFFQKDFLTPFLHNPVQSFTMGTWIAGVSVLCNVLLKYFPFMLPVLQAMAIINVILWSIFLFTMIKSFRTLFIKTNKSVHGVILLSTVGTQSIVILLNNLFDIFPSYLMFSLIILGIIFYLLGIYILIKRYKTVEWDLVNDWQNTNCILHGALSITGLAMVTSELFSSEFLSAFWLMVLFILFLVETIEVARAYKRIKQLGFSKGIWVYHISQWSRNFTFGMFFAFTLALNISSVYNMPSVLEQLQLILLPLWAKVVFLSLIIQLVIYVQSRTTQNLSTP